MPTDSHPITDADIARLSAWGVTTDEIWCAIAEPGPWTRTLDDAR